MKNEKMIYICIPTTPERRARVSELVASIYAYTTDMRFAIVVYENEDGGWVKAVRNMLSGIDGYVVLLGSDCVVTENWLGNLWRGFWAAFPDGDGVAQPYDDINEGRLAQHPLARSKTILEYLDPEFIHNFSDNWMTLRLMNDEKYAYIPSSKIIHNHFINRRAPKDKTYEKVFESYEQDKRTFERKLAEWNRAVAVENFESEHGFVI